jgi:hypothetical protein
MGLGKRSRFFLVALGVEDTGGIPERTVDHAHTDPKGLARSVLTSRVDQERYARPLVVVRLPWPRTVPPLGRHEASFGDLHRTFS